MKYMVLMRKLFLTLFLVTLTTISFAQKGSNSPFSSYGLGEIGGLDNASFIGIGNSTITLIDSTTLNFYNPSSYSNLSKHQPLFSLGISSKLSKYSENGLSSTGSVTSIQHFALAFSFAKRFGFAFGLRPFSSRGYEFSSRIKVADDSLKYVYEGTGGLNEVFTGLSVNALNYKGAKVSVGANLGYVFGRMTNLRKSAIITSGSSVFAGGVSSKRIQAKAFRYTLGFNYSQTIKKNHLLGISVVYDPFQKIKAEYENALFYSPDIDNENAYDTLSVNDTLSGNLSTIPTLTYGLSYELSFKARKGQTNELNSKIGFHLSYSAAEWSKYENTFDPDFTNTFLNSTKMTFGIQYLPETDPTMSKFHQRVRYRAGVYQIKMPYVTNGERVSDFGTTFGFGIPIIIQNSLSSVNLGFSIGNRGISDSNALKERYYGINIGISIAPGTDRWFVKRKLN
tara:strand:- start:2018 stop:3376 length:1359 start_codon:yes stop_codon:yes gene_type:complete